MVVGELGLEKRGSPPEDVVEGEKALEGDEGALGAVEAAEDSIDHGGSGGAVVAPEG